MLCDWWWSVDWCFRRKNVWRNVEKNGVSVCSCFCISWIFIIRFKSGCRGFLKSYRGL